jgi:rubrerythrin
MNEPVPFKIKRNIVEKIVKDVFKKLKEDTEYYQDGKTYATPNLTVAAAIRGAIKSESDAIEIYLNILKLLKNKEDIEKIQEIISDEKSHEKTLIEINERYEKIPPNKY